LVMRQRQVPQGDYRQFQALDDAFHRAMAIAVGRAYAWEIVEQSKAQMDRVRFLSLTMLTPFDMLADQHMQIIDALASGNPTAAANATAEHLHVLEHTLPEIVRVHPELFDEAPVR